MANNPTRRIAERREKDEKFLINSLKKFGIDVDIDSLPDVKISEKPVAYGEERKVTLSPEAPLGGIIRKVECYDLDEIKELIGIPNRIACSRQSEQMRRLDLEKFSPDTLERQFDKGGLGFEEMQFLRTVGEAYVYGDSENVKSFKPILERVFTRGAGRFDLTVGCYGSFWVANGHTFSLPASFQVFCALALYLEPSAKFLRRESAHVKMNIGTIADVDPQLPI